MSSNSQQQQNEDTTSPLVDSIISGDRQGGILCNDPSGLCVASQNLDVSQSGVYTSLLRLASQLQQQGEATDSSPLITIETDTSAILVKEYDGHAVALRVPATGEDATDSSQ